MADLFKGIKKMTIYLGGISGSCEQLSFSEKHAFSCVINIVTSFVKPNKVISA